MDFGNTRFTTGNETRQTHTMRLYRIRRHLSRVGKCSPTSPQRARGSRSRLQIIGCLLLAIACRDTPVPIGTPDVQRALGGLRPIQARLTGLDFAPCSSTHDLIPIARCGEPIDPSRVERLRSITRQLHGQLEQTPGSDELQAAALLTLAIAGDQPTRVQFAIALLREARDLEPDSRRRAQILADLAAAHLQLGELLQSPLEIAVALEEALHSLELDPAGVAGAFNRDLALAFLGVEELRDAAADTWRSEIESRLHYRKSFRSSGPETHCLSRRDMRRALDAWASDITLASQDQLSVQGACWKTSEDRFFADLLSAAESTPRPTAAAWKELRDAEATLRRFDLESAATKINALQGHTLPLPLVLAARVPEATLAYQHLAYSDALEILEPLAEEAKTASYSAMAAQVHRLIALIYEIRGEYGAAFHHLDQALERARAAHSKTLEAATLALRVELEQRVGREEEAWRTLTEALLRLHPATQRHQRLISLHTAASLARSRELYRTAAVLHAQAVSTAAEVGPVPRILALKNRCEHHLEIGRHDLARDDLETARQVLTHEVSDPGTLATLDADLLFLEGQAAESLNKRRQALVATVEHFRSSGYDLRILTARGALARLHLEAGDSERATGELRSALAELEEQVRDVNSWADATALVAAARPLTDTLLDLELGRREPSEALATLARFLGLRTGAPTARATSSESQRLSYFVRDDEVLIFLEVAGELHLLRHPATRENLAELRQLLLLQLRSYASEARIAATSLKLSRILIDPIVEMLAPGKPLVILADDVLAGLPFALLPAGSSGQLLIDRHPLSYTTDLHPAPTPTTPRTFLAVGVAAPVRGLSPLPTAEQEASQVAALYPSADLLIADEANAPNVGSGLGDYDAVHVASHFIVNLRYPLASYLALTGAEEASSQLTLEDLHRLAPAGLSLLYLSACDTGRGLPPSARGLHSLAQVFASIGIERTVLSLWPLEDEIAADISIAFHRALSGGDPAAEALREAQLRHRDQHPTLWASLALYH